MKKGWRIEEALTEQEIKNRMRHSEFKQRSDHALDDLFNRQWSASLQGFRFVQQPQPFGMRWAKAAHECLNEQIFLRTEVVSCRVEIDLRLASKLAHANPVITILRKESFGGIKETIHRNVCFRLHDSIYTYV